MKRNVISLTAIAVLAGSFLCMPQQTEAAKAKNVTMDAALNVTVNTRRPLELKNNKKKVTWKVLSGAKSVTLKNKKKGSVTIVAKEIGTAKVMAVAGGKKYTCKVTVKNAPKMTFLGTEGINEKDLAALQEIVDTQLARNPYSADDTNVKYDFSKDYEDDAQYICNEEGRIVEILWDARTIRGDVDLTKLEALTYVCIEECGELTGIDVSGCKELRKADVGFNPELKEVHLSGCSTLWHLNLSNNSNLEKLNLGECSALERLYCSHTKLSSLNLSDCSGLKELVCRDNNCLSDLDISSCKALECLVCWDNNCLSALDISSCKALKYLYCSCDVYLDSTFTVQDQGIKKSV